MQVKAFAALHDYREFHFIKMDLFETSIKQILRNKHNSIIFLSSSMQILIPSVPSTVQYIML